MAVLLTELFSSSSTPFCSLAIRAEISHIIGFDGVFAQFKNIILTTLPQMGQVIGLIWAMTGCSVQLLTLYVNSFLCRLSSGFLSPSYLAGSGLKNFGFCGWRVSVDAVLIELREDLPEQLLTLTLGGSTSAPLLWLPSGDWSSL